MVQISTMSCTLSTTTCRLHNSVVFKNTFIVLVSRSNLYLRVDANLSGRTGRIGNLGLATSFYNSRDSDLGPVLVKTLIETHQKVPDFLQEFVPEGFVNNGEDIFEVIIVPTLFLVLRIKFLFTFSRWILRQWS